MTVNVTKNGYSLFIVSTSKAEILSTLVSECYPKPVAFIYNSGDATYHVLAYRLQ